MLSRAAAGMAALVVDAHGAGAGDGGPAAETGRGGEGTRRAGGLCGIRRAGRQIAEVNEAICEPGPWPRALIMPRARRGQKRGSAISLPAEAAAEVGRLAAGVAALPAGGARIERAEPAVAVILLPCGGRPVPLGVGYMWAADAILPWTL